MADNSGAAGILGVIIGGVIVVAVAIYFLTGFGGNDVDLNIKPPSIPAPK